MTQQQSCSEGKRAAAFAAALRIQEGMTVGIGTGSTAEFFIEALKERFEEGISITTVASSVASEKLLKEKGIPVLDINNVQKIDITIDGADEVDPLRRLIKGGGGALLREKIVATASKEVVIIVDEKKRVEHLGLFPLPIEVVHFGYLTTLQKIQDLGYKAFIRTNNINEPFITDNGNVIIDIVFDTPPKDISHDVNKIKDIVGVIETGFFTNIADIVIIGDKEGKIHILK